MSDKVEIEFQKWLKKQEPDMREDLCSWSAFIGWQAAIESISIKLPQPNDDSQDQIMRGVYAAIDNEGVSYE